MVLQTFWVCSPLVLSTTPASQAHFHMVQEKKLRATDGSNIFKGPRQDWKSPVFSLLLVWEVYEGPWEWQSWASADSLGFTLGTPEGHSPPVQCTSEVSI